MPIDKKRKTYLLVILVLILLIVSHYLKLTRWLENSVQKILTPVSTKIYQTANSLGGVYESTFKKDEFWQNYQTCLNQKKNGDYYEAQIILLTQENADLRAQLNLKAKKQYQTVVAEVMGKNLDGIEQAIIINRGEQDGIKNGQPVITASGVLVGKISEVRTQTAMVRLINDNQSKIAANILNESKSMGVVEGGFGLSLTMKLIPRNETVLVGQKVITSGLEEGIPNGLLIGEISIIENEAYKPFQQAVLNPATELDKIDLVSVIVE